jgi:hypothetical protein
VFVSCCFVVVEDNVLLRGNVRTTATDSIRIFDNQVKEEKEVSCGEGEKEVEVDGKSPF